MPALNLGSLCELLVCAKHDIMTSFALHIISNYFKDLGIYLCSVLYGLWLLERLSESTSWVYLLSSKNWFQKFPIMLSSSKDMVICLTWLSPVLKKIWCTSYSSSSIRNITALHSQIISWFLPWKNSLSYLGYLSLIKIPFTGSDKAPKYEDIASPIHLKRSDIEANWETRSGVKGLLTKFLIKKAREFIKAMSFHAFKDIVALLIYGLVLFPNPDQFIDVNAIKMFL